MNKEMISDKQCIVLIIMFIGSTAALSVRGIEAEQDFWICIILSLAISILMAIIYSRLYYTFPNKDLFDIFEICFGKFIGKIFMIFYTYFFLESGTMVLINFSHFANLTTLDHTPLIVIKISILILCILTIKPGIKVLGRWSEFTVAWVIAFIGISVILSIPNMDLNNIRPIFNSGIKPIIKGTFSTFTFPFGEIVAFYAVFSSFKKRKSPYKIYILGLLIGGILTLIVSATNVLVLGVSRASTYLHPTYTTMARITIGNAIQRIEVIITLIFTLGIFIKISIYLLATTKAITKTFNFEDYRFLVIPTALFMLILSHFLFIGVSEFWEYFDVWNYSALLFQVIFPIILFIVAEIKNKRLINHL